MNVDPPQTDAPSLTCWKDIARYLGKGVRTVQRWEQEFALPIRRPDGASYKSAVCANPRDLDAWRHLHWSLRSSDYKSLRSVKYTLRSAKYRSTVSGINTDHDDLFREMKTGLQISRALRAELSVLRTEHRQLSRELSSSVHSLVESCHKRHVPD